jgi:hypothetical protein
MSTKDEYFQINDIGQVRRVAFIVLESIYLLVNSKNSNTVKKRYDLVSNWLSSLTNVYTRIEYKQYCQIGFNEYCTRYNLNISEIQEYCYLILNPSRASVILPQIFRKNINFLKMESENQIYSQKATIKEKNDLEITKSSVLAGQEERIYDEKGFPKLNIPQEVKDNAKKFDLNIQRLLDSWEIHHALREIIANALDEQKLTSSNDIEIMIKYRNIWTIRDFGRGLKIEHLVLNENEEKINNTNLIGKFGVGLKDALATLCRNGKIVFIKSKHCDITIGESQKHNFEDMITLHAYIMPASDPNMDGTEFAIKNISEKDIETAKSQFLIFSSEELLENTTKGSVFSKKNNLANIYINGIKVSEENNFLFSYNISELNADIKKALNRERNYLPLSAYSKVLKEILTKSQSPFIAECLVDELQFLNSGKACHEIKWIDVAMHAVRLLNDKEKVMFVSNDELLNNGFIINLAKQDGYKIITVTDDIKNKISETNINEREVICNTQVFNKTYNDSFQYEIVAIDDLNQNEKIVLSNTFEIFDLIGGKPSMIKNIEISEKMRINENSEIVLGVWDSVFSTIFLNRKVLQNKNIFASTLLHETAHASCGSSDGTFEFERELTRMLGILSEKYFLLKDEDKNFWNKLKHKLIK